LGKGKQEKYSFLKKGLRAMEKVCPKMKENLKNR
jgi:hypothetical protein